MSEGMNLKLGGLHGSESTSVVPYEPVVEVDATKLSRVLFSNYIQYIGMAVVPAYVESMFGPDYLATTIGTDRVQVLESNWASTLELVRGANRPIRFRHNKVPDAADCSFRPMDDEFLCANFSWDSDSRESDGTFNQNGISYGVSIRPKMSPAGLQTQMLSSQLRADYRPYDYNKFGWFGVRTGAAQDYFNASSAFPLIRNDINPDTATDLREIYDEQSSENNARMRLLDPVLSTIPSVDLCVFEAESIAQKVVEQVFTVPNPNLPITTDLPNEFVLARDKIGSDIVRAMDQKRPFGKTRSDAKKLLSTLKEGILRHPGGQYEVNRLLEREWRYDGREDRFLCEMDFVYPMDVSASVLAMASILRPLLESDLKPALVQGVVDQSSINRNLLALLR